MRTRSISRPSDPVPARLHDGTSARVRTVSIWRDGPALVIVGAPGEERIDATLLSRDVAEGRITLRRADLPDWGLAIAAADAAAFRDLPGRHRLTRRGARWVGGSVTALVALAALVWAFGNDALVWAAPLVPRRVAEGVGGPYADMLAGGTHGCHAAAGEAALMRLVTRITPRRGFVEPARVRVARDATVNAFTLPGGEVIVLSGLIDAAGSPDELAGVIAHEFGHVQARHPAQALLRHFGLDLFISGIGGNIGAIAATGLFLRNSRAAEQEADGAALTILRDARISPVGVASFFARAERARDGETPFAALAATHPSDRSRQARFRDAAGAYGATPALTPAEWAALKAICV